MRHQPKSFRLGLPQAELLLLTRGLVRDLLVKMIYGEWQRAATASTGDTPDQIMKLATNPGSMQTIKRFLKTFLILSLQHKML